MQLDRPRSVRSNHSRGRGVGRLRGNHGLAFKDFFTYVKRGVLDHDRRRQAIGR